LGRINHEGSGERVESKKQMSALSLKTNCTAKNSGGKKGKGNKERRREECVELVEESGERKRVVGGYVDVCTLGWWRTSADEGTVENQFALVRCARKEEWMVGVNGRCQDECRGDPGKGKKKSLLLHFQLRWEGRIGMMGKKGE